MRKGFDSRFTTTIPENTEYEFAGIKISEAVRGGPYTQPLIQWNLATELGLDKLPFHFWRGSNDDPKQDGIEQAEWFYSVYEQHFKPVSSAELPPVIDCEDKYALKGLRSLNNILYCLKRTEELWGRRPLVYSAGWWWDDYIKPYTTRTNLIYTYDLWEADPPPDTPIGYWNESVITQVRLDFMKEGFTASIDENEALEEWYREQTDEKDNTKERLTQIRNELTEIIETL